MRDRRLVEGQFAQPTTNRLLYHLIDAEGRVINLKNCKVKVFPTIEGKNFIDIKAVIDLEDRVFIEHSPYFHFISPNMSSIKVKKWNSLFMRLYSKYNIKGQFLQI